MKASRTAAILFLALLVAPGCAAWCNKPDPGYLKLIACSAVMPTPQPPAEPGTVITPGVQECVTSSVPAYLQLEIRGKQPGNAEREEVTMWAFAEGGDWRGGNPLPPTFGVRCNDSRPDWAKLKVYRDGHTGAAEKEQPLAMAWNPAETYRLRLDVAPGLVTWTAGRLSDGVTVKARQEAATPSRVTICWGDPGTRKAAIGATVWRVERGVTP
jgi:hypothetical protein